jgi:hypothetical protein
MSSENVKIFQKLSKLIIRTMADGEYDADAAEKFRSEKSTERDFTSGIIDDTITSGLRIMIAFLTGSQPCGCGLLKTANLL